MIDAKPRFDRTHAAVAGAALLVGALLGSGTGIPFSSAAATPNVYHLAPGEQVIVIADATPVPTPTAAPSPTLAPTPAPTPVPTASPSPVVTPGATPSPTAVPTPTPAPTNSPVPSPSFVVGSATYGSAIAADTKSNIQDHTKVAHRFVSPSTGVITSIRAQERGGPVYSGGTGGHYIFGIQADVNGVPSGTYIGATGSYVPGNSGTWDRFDAVTVSAQVLHGLVYYAVFENIDANPSANYFSINEIYTYSSLSPRQPRFTDAEFAALAFESGKWVTHRETPDFDVTFADGTHAGQSYIGMIGINGMAVYAATISGPTLVRETLNPVVPFRIGSASVRVRRDHGTDPLTIAVIDKTGVVVAFGSVPAAQVPQSTAGGDNGGSAWVTVTFPSVMFTGGEIRLSTASSSAYTAAPIRDGSADGSGFSKTLGFPDGIFQISTNSGATFTDPYSGGILDMQFYLR